MITGQFPFYIYVTPSGSNHKRIFVVHRPAAGRAGKQSHSYIRSEAEIASERLGWKEERHLYSQTMKIQIQDCVTAKQNWILSIGFLLSILILFVNDFYLKSIYPGILTGKLSDVAGLFALPFFISALLPAKKKWIYGITITIFVLWKLPIADNFIALWNRYMFYAIGRTVDYTDYLALLILPFSYYYKPRNIIFRNNYFINAVKTSVISIAVFSFLATAGTHGRIKGYQYNYSKYEIVQAMHLLYQQHPEYVVPDQWKSLTTPHVIGSNSDPDIQALNADSVNFDFYIESKSPFILWSSFVNVQENWYDDKCELVLEGYIAVSRGQWKFNDDLPDEEKQKITKYFEENILKKLKNILQERKGTK